MKKKCVYVHCATSNGPSAADLYVQRERDEDASEQFHISNRRRWYSGGRYLLSFFCHFDFFRIKWRTTPTYHDEDDGRYANIDAWLDSAINVPPRHLQLAALVPCLATGGGP